MRTGTVFINTAHILQAETPFGGFKQSGWGREMSEISIEEFTQPKSITEDKGGFTKYFVKMVQLH